MNTGTTSDCESQSQRSSFRPDDIPAELKAHARWVCWRAVQRPGAAKPTKEPIDPHTGKLASVSNPSTWTDFQTAVEACTKNSNWGVGFVLGDGFSGVDVDACVNPVTKTPDAAASKIIAKLDTYTEFSPSGTGLHLLLIGKLPPGGRRNHKVEMYDSARFFTMTGRHLPGTPLTIEPRQAELEALHREIFAAANPPGNPHEAQSQANPTPPATPPPPLNDDQVLALDDQVLEHAREAKNGDKFRSLFDQGDISGYRSASEADAALLLMLAFWCEKNATQMDRLFRRSALSRPKWDEKRGDQTYGERSIAGAIKRQKQIYTPPPQWCEDLILNQDGKAKAILANAITALREAPEWAGVPAFNEFSLGTVALQPAPWGGPTAGSEWTDHEDLLTANWLQHAGIFVSVEVAGQAVQAVARDRYFHPVREYLDSLKWDGVARIDTWLSTYLGVKPSDYTKAVGSRWLISAVARIYRPGTKADCCLILEGPQGQLKSTALKTIAGDWFTDEIADLGSKDAAMQTKGVWIIEIPELDSMSKSEVSKIKAFISRATDRFRPPYDKRLIESPRQSVFAGSVNHSTYLRDETGGRRFWPVNCGRIDLDGLRSDRDQLWAEATVRFRAGAPWWLDSIELNRIAEQEQADRYEGDSWDDLIARWVENPSERPHYGSGPAPPFSSTRESVSISDILTHCIGKPQENWAQIEKNRVARSLVSMGWERYRPRHGAVREWRYRKP